NDSEGVRQPRSRTERQDQLRELGVADHVQARLLVLLLERAEEVSHVDAVRRLAGLETGGSLAAGTRVEPPDHVPREEPGTLSPARARDGADANPAADDERATILGREVLDRESE